MTLLWTISAAAAAAYWWFSLHSGTSILRSVVKGLAVGSLSLMALLAGAPLLALALAFCTVGDVALSRPGQGAFLAGLIAFALGHAVWMVVFAAEVGLQAALLAQPLRALLLLAMGVAAIRMASLLHPRAGPLGHAVLAYIAIILLMIAAGLATPGWWIAAGALLFAASDMALGLQTFVLAQGTRRERRINAVIWPLYYGAIVLMTCGVLGVSS